MYHAHLRPLTTLPAAALDLAASLHRAAPSWAPTPAGALRALARAVSTPQEEAERASPLHSVANALTVPPVHVEHVAGAVCAAVEDERVSGPVGVREIRELVGWADAGARGAAGGAAVLGRGDPGERGRGFHCQRAVAVWRMEARLVSAAPAFTVTGRSR